jgi:hypothetical protein
VLALLQRLATGQQPAAASSRQQPAVGSSSLVNVASVGIGRQERKLVYYIDVDHLTHTQVNVSAVVVYGE